MRPLGRSRLVPSTTRCRTRCFTDSLSNHPRQLNQVENTVYLSGELSCPEIARLIIENDDACQRQPGVKRQFPEQLIKSTIQNLSQRDHALFQLNKALISDLNHADTPFESLQEWVMQSAVILGQRKLQQNHFPEDTRSRVNDIIFNDVLMLLRREGGGPFAKLWHRIQPDLPKRQNELDGDAILRKANLKLTQQWPWNTRQGIMSRILIASLHSNPITGRQHWSEMRQLFLQISLIGIGAAFLQGQGNAPMIESLYAQSRLFSHSKDMSTQLDPLFEAAGLNDQVGATLILDLMQQIWGHP